MFPPRQGGQKILPTLYGRTKGATPAARSGERSEQDRAAGVGPGFSPGCQASAASLAARRKSWPGPGPQRSAARSCRRQLHDLRSRHAIACLAPGACADDGSGPPRSAISRPPFTANYQKKGGPPHGKPQKIRPRSRFEPTPAQ
mgnify:FL=1